MLILINLTQFVFIQISKYSIKALWEIMTFNYPWWPGVYRPSSPWPAFCWSSSSWFFELFLYLNAFSFNSLAHRDHSVELDFKWFNVGSPMRIWRIWLSFSRVATVKFHTHPDNLLLMSLEEKVWLKTKTMKHSERKNAFGCHCHCYIWTVRLREVLWFFSINLGNPLP